MLSHIYLTKYIHKTLSNTYVQVHNFLTSYIISKFESFNIKVKCTMRQRQFKVTKFNLLQIAKINSCSKDMTV